MAGRSQRHMREFSDHFTSDASGQQVPRQVATIPDPASGTTVNEDFSSYFAGYPRTYSATNLPTSTTINATTGVVTGTTTAQTWNNVSITVTNSFGTATSATFTWTVT